LTVFRDSERLIDIGQQRNNNIICENFEGGTIIYIPYLHSVHIQVCGPKKGNHTLKMTQQKGDE